MNWTEANNALREGKHIRHKGWRQGVSWYMEGESYYCQAPYITPDIFQHYPLSKRDIDWAKHAKWELV